MFCAFRVVLNVSTLHCLGKLMCYHYTTAAKNNKTQQFRSIFSTFEHCS